MRLQFHVWFNLLAIKRNDPVFLFSFSLTLVQKSPLSDLALSLAILAILLAKGK